MVVIIAGEIDAGKTTKLLEIYETIKSGDGIIAKKVFTAGTFTGYELVRLTTGEKKLFAVLKENLPDEWEEVFSHRRFSFSKKAFEFAEHTFEQILAEKITPIFIDEIGPLELSGKGFDEIFKKLLEANRKIYAAIRTDCVKSVIEKYAIKDYEVIELRQRKQL